MVWADLADRAGASSGDVKVDALAAWLTTHDERLAQLESGAPATSNAHSTGLARCAWAERQQLTTRWAP